MTRGIVQEKFPRAGEDGRRVYSPEWHYAGEIFVKALNLYRKESLENAPQSGSKRAQPNT